MNRFTTLLKMLWEATETVASFLKTSLEKRVPLETVKSAIDKDTDNVVIGPKTCARGLLNAENTIVKGHVQGQIRSSKLVITNTGTLIGRVFSQSLEVEEQAEVDAECRVIEEDNESQKVGIEEK